MSKTTTTTLIIMITHRILCCLLTLGPSIVAASSQYPRTIITSEQFDVIESNAAISVRNGIPLKASPIFLAIPNTSLFWMFWFEGLFQDFQLIGQQYSINNGQSISTVNGKSIAFSVGGYTEAKVMKAVLIDDNAAANEPMLAILANHDEFIFQAQPPFGLYFVRTWIRTFDADGQIVAQHLIDNQPYRRHCDMLEWTDNTDNVQYLVVSYFTTINNNGDSIRIRVLRVSDLFEMSDILIKQLDPGQQFSFFNNLKGPSLTRIDDGNNNNNNNNQMILSFTVGAQGSPFGRAIFLTLDAPDSITVSNEITLIDVARLRLKSINNGRNVLVVGQMPDETQFMLAVYDSTLTNICAVMKGTSFRSLFEFTEVNIPTDDTIIVLSVLSDFRGTQRVTPQPEMRLLHFKDLSLCSPIISFNPVISWNGPSSGALSLLSAGFAFSNDGDFLMFYEDWNPAESESFFTQYRIAMTFTPLNLWTAQGWTQVQQMPSIFQSTEACSPVVLKDESNKYWVIWGSQDGSKLMGQRYDASNHELDSTFSIDYGIQVSSVLSAVYIESDSKLAILSTHQGRMTLSSFDMDGVFEQEHLIVDNPLFPEHGHLITLTAANSQEYLAVSYFDDHRIKLAVFDDLSNEPARMDLSSGSGVSFDPNRNLRGPKMVALGDQGLFAVSWFEMRNLREKSSVAIFQLSDASTLQIKSIRNMGRWVNPTLTSLSDDLIAVINNDKHNLLSDDQYSLNLFRVSSDGALKQCGEPTIHSTGRFSMWNRVSTLWTVHPATVSDIFLFVSHRNLQAFEDSFTQVWRVILSDDGSCALSTEPGMGWSVNLSGSFKSSVFEGIELSGNGDFIVPFEDIDSSQSKTVRTIIYNLEMELAL